MPVKLSRSLKEVRWRPLGRAHRHFLPYVLRYRAGLLGGLACLLGGLITTLLAPWPLKLVFDHVLPGQAGSPRPLPPWMAGFLPASPMGILVVACVAVLLITILAGFFSFGQNLLTAKAAQKILFRIRRDVFAHVQRLPLTFHTNRQTGDLLMRMTGDVQMLREILVDSVITFAGRLILIAAMILIMLWLSPQLTLVALCVLPLLVFVLLRFSGRLRQATRNQRNREGKVATVISEVIGSIAVVQSFSRAGFEDDKLARQTRGSLRAGLRATRIKEGMTRSAEIVVALGKCGVLGYGAVLVLRGNISAGDLLVFLSYLSGIYKPLRELSRLTARLAKASICAERILDLLDMDEHLVDAEGAQPAPPLRGDITFEEVSLTYARRENPALDSVSFSVRAGETVILAGESGAGKTSIASLLLRLHAPSSGRILLDGTDVSQFTLESVREQIAVVLQESVLFGTSIAENIAYGRPDASPEEIEAAAREVHAHDFIEALPQGYGTIIGERGLDLSGGQRQRIALARAAIRRAPLLLLDEPTTGLDAESERAVLEGIRALARHATTIIITHRPELFLDVDQVLNLEGGRVIQQSAAPAAQVQQIPSGVSCG